MREETSRVGRDAHQLGFPRLEHSLILGSTPHAWQKARARGRASEPISTVRILREVAAPRTARHRGGAAVGALSGAAKTRRHGLFNRARPSTITSIAGHTHVRPASPGALYGTQNNFQRSCLNVDDCVGRQVPSLHNQLQAREAGK